MNACVCKQPERADVEHGEFRCSLRFSLRGQCLDEERKSRVRAALIRRGLLVPVETQQRAAA